MTTGSIVGDNSDDKTSESGTTNNPPELVRIIHKEQDSISAFCLNQVKNDIVDRL